MKMKNHIKPALTLSLVALVALTASVRADDSEKSQSNDSSKQSSDNSSNNSENSQKSEDSSNQNGEKVVAKAEVSLSGGVVSPVQSKADPYGLKLAGQVMQAGSDASSKDFQQNVLPSLNSFIKSALPESKINTASKAFEIDPNKLVMATKSDVRAYFVYEGAAYHNSLGVDVTTLGNDPSSSAKEVSSPASRLIFPDASSTEGGIASGTYGTRTASEPVLPGDFVNLGTFAKGTKLDFFLMANGANQSGSSVFSAIESINGDGFKQHVAGFTTKLFAVPQLNSPYIFLSLEDLWGGGDKDINDTIIAINVGTATVKSLLATPEPATWLTLGSFLALAVWAKRRLDCKTKAVEA
jgi:hypothetical protein